MNRFILFLLAFMMTVIRLKSNPNSNKISMYQLYFAMNISEKVIQVLWLTDQIPELMWEFSYLNEIFPAPYFNHIMYDPSTSFSIQPVSVSGISTQLGAIVCTELKQVPIIQRLTSNQQIPVLIHLSDEFLGKRKETMGCSKVYDRAKLVLRQYAWHENAKNPTLSYPHMIQLPLGYMTGMFGKIKYFLPNETSNLTKQEIIDDINSIQNSYLVGKLNLQKLSSQRVYNWSFVGGKHGREDRSHALNVWLHWNNHTNLEGVAPSLMKEIYEASKFVIIGRGWNTLDCFRIYEAIICGALPVVVGHSEEIKHIFAFDGHIPPLVYAPTWEEGLEICKKMSDEEIDRCRVSNTNWYFERLHDIEEHIAKVLNVPVRQQLL